MDAHVVKLSPTISKQKIDRNLEEKNLPVENHASTPTRTDPQHTNSLFRNFILACTSSPQIRVANIYRTSRNQVTDIAKV